MPKSNIGVFGSTGRMGKAVVDLIATEFAGQADLAASVSNRAGGLDDLAEVDVVIDFSLPGGTALLVDWLHSCERRAPALVSGTTGLNADTLDRLKALGTKTKILHSTNFSAGVAALGSILEFAAPLLTALGYTPVLTESHHKHKLDAPSGTAKSMLEILQPESPESVQVHSIRAGELIGEHEVTFYAAHDEIGIRHEAKDRRLFARGAIDDGSFLLP